MSLAPVGNSRRIGEGLDSGHHTAKVDGVNARNALTDVALAGPSGGVQVHVRYDAAGNLSFDGQYFYQYDAWGRLLQVNRAHEGPPPMTGGEPTGDPDQPVDTPVLLDQLVKHWTYDGLGRLVRTQSPWPDPDIGVATGLLRSERFYYDGIRRVQEVVTDPVASQGVIQGAGAGTPGEGPADPNADPSVATITSEQGQINGAQGSSPPTALPQTVTSLVREYVWGPGDGPGGVDELLVQYAGSDRGKAWWVLQDGGGDVAALVETPSPGAQAVVAAQWTYDAYGSCLTAEHLRAYPLVHCGHKALFFDRLDVGVVASSGDEIARLAPYAHAVYQVRNRAYAPALGRFYQRDPNATAMALIEATAFHGRGLSEIIGAFSIESQYGDGMNLYEYLGSNPWRRHDYLGLSSDPFDMVDEYLAEATGNTAAFLSQIGQGLRATAVVVATIASNLPFPITSTLGELALVSLGQETSEEFALGAAVGLIPGGKLMSRFGGVVRGLGSFLGRMGSSAWSSARHYAGRFTGWLSNKLHGLAARTRELLRRKPGSACGCFTEGTLVWTTQGLIPIEEVRVGDLVLTKDESGAIGLKSVDIQIVTQDAALLELTVGYADGEMSTIQTTDEHPFWAVGLGWRRADLLRPGQAIASLRGHAAVISLTFTSQRAAVYNLTIGGSPNYFVGPDGLWVHNCNPVTEYRNLFKDALAMTGRELPATYQVHHRLPQEWRHLFPGGEVDQLENWAGVSQQVHGQINGEWTRFRAGYPNPTSDVVRTFSMWIDANYGQYFIRP